MKYKIYGEKPYRNVRTSHSDTRNNIQQNSYLFSASHVDDVYPALCPLTCSQFAEQHSQQTPLGDHS